MRQGSAETFIVSPGLTGSNEMNVVIREGACRGIDDERGLGKPSLSQRKDLGAVNLPDPAVLVDRWKHTMGCTANLDFRPDRMRGKNIYFLYSTAYTVPTRRGFGIEVSCKSLIFGGPCRGRTYGPLIKSGKRSSIRTARCCEGFPV